MNWRNVLAAVGNFTPSYGYAWPSDAGGRIGVWLGDEQCDRYRALAVDVRLMLAAADMRDVDQFHRAVAALRETLAAIDEEESRA